MLFERNRSYVSCVAAAFFLLVAGSVFAQHSSSTRGGHVTPVIFAGKDDFSLTKQTPAPKSVVDSTPRKKSMWKAAALSLAIPGAGQFYLGKRDKAKIYVAVETAAWAGFIGFKVYSHWKKNDLIKYAREHAGADLAGRNDEFLDLVGFYVSTREYNALGRVSDPERPYFDESPANYWEWQTGKERAVYRDLKNGSREANRRAEFMVGLAVVNRILSTIDAIRDARRMERSLDDSFSQAKQKRVLLAFDPYDSQRQLKLTILTGW